MPDTTSNDDIWSGPGTNPLASANPDPEYTRVEAERIEDGGGVRGYAFVERQAAVNPPKPPVVSTWICLFLAWLFLGSSVPFTIFIGLPLNFAALFLGTICLARGGILTGILVLLLGTIGSVVVYLMGWVFLIGNAAALS